MDTNQEQMLSPAIEKLTDWKNKPSVSDLKQDFKDAQSDHQLHTSKVSTYLDNLNVTGSALVKTRKGRSKVVPKLIRKQAEWRYASLSEPFLSTDDLFDVDPVTYEDKESAYQNALVLNNQFNTKINKVKFIDEYVRTAVDEGTVICKVGWKYSEKEVEVEVEQFDYEFTDDPAYLDQLVQIDQLVQSQSPDLANVPPELMNAYESSVYNNSPVKPVSIGFETVTEVQVVENYPTVEVCDYRNVLVDPTCKGDIDQASFVIHSFETSMAELKKDGRYKNLDAVNVEAVNPLSEPDHSTDDLTAFKFNDKPRKRIVAYEYWGFWDIEGTGLVEPIVATYVGDVLIRLERNPFPDKKLPFVVCQYLPVRHSVYGEPDGVLLEDNQKIIGAVTRGMIDTMGRSANGQMAVRKDALDVSNRRKFDNGEDYEFNATVDPRQAFHMHTYPEIPQSASLMLQLQNAEAESLTGVKAFTGGISGQALGNTATGVRSALDATAKRELNILRRLAKGVKDIGRKIISMNSEFLSEEEVVRVTNEEFVTVRRDDLSGNFDLKLSISTPEADEQKASELAFMLQTTAQSMSPMFTQVILAEIARLRKMPELAKRIKEYAPEPDPLAQRKAELEIALLEAQIENERNKGIKQYASANLDMARVNTEEAKTGNLNSDTDLKNLDFVEQETGTKQARNIQLENTRVEGKAALNSLQDSFKRNEDSTMTTNGIRPV